MDIAIVIGGNTGVGLAISRKLIILGFRIYAIADDFTKTPFAHKDFFPISIPLDKPEELSRATMDILDKEDNVFTIINAPEKTVDASFDTLSALDIQAYLTHYLLNPILLTRLTISKIKQFQGFIINIMHENSSSALNCAVQGGLSAFYASLFEDYRNHGVNVTDILVESTTHNPVNCEMVANTIDHLIRFKGGNAVTKISIRSQDAQALSKFPQITPSIDEFKEIQLPPKSNFPPEQEPILTQEPKRIASKRTSQKPSHTTKVSRETVLIPKEKKIRTAKPALPINRSEKTQPIIPREAKPKRAPKKPIQPKLIAPLPASTPPASKISRDSIVIPRERKSRASELTEAQRKTEEPTLPSNEKPPSPLAPPMPPRIRRGRPPIKKEL